MFKKTLVAAALLAVGFNASAALTVANTGNAGATGELVSVEGTATGSAVALSSLTVTSSAAAKATYTSFSGLSVALTGASFNPATAITLTVADSAATSSTLTLTTHYTVKFASASRVEITVNSAGLSKLGTDTLDLTTGANVFTIGGINVNATDIASNAAISASVEADSNIPNVDLETGSKTIATGKTQFAMANLKADGTTSGKTVAKIDVAQGRTYFAGGTKTKSDTVTATVTSISVDLNKATTAATNKVTWTLKGDMSFLDADADGKLDTGTSILASDNAAAATATGVTVAADMQSATFTSATPAFTGAAAQTREVAFTVSTDGSRVIPVTAFTIDAAMAYEDSASLAGSFAKTGVSLGGWTLNGDGAYISFMPFGSAFSQSVTITNKGTVDGSISVDWFYNGSKTTTALTTTAAPKGVTDISNELRTIAAANGITGNVALDLIINSPSGQISVDALYYSKADQDRGVMATDK